MGTPAGLQTDCEALLSRFQKMDSVRFEDFTELWRKMKFGTIFWWVFMVHYPPLPQLRGCCRFHSLCCPAPGKGGEKQESLNAPLHLSRAFA